MTLNLKSLIKAQQGAVLVLSAELLPAVILAAGFTVDLGNAYIQKAKMQNAADAATLAAVGQITHREDLRKDRAAVEPVVLKYLQANLSSDDVDHIGAWKNSSCNNANGKDIESTSGSFAAHYEIKRDIEPELTLTLQKNVPTIFMRYFGESFSFLTVSAASSAQIPNEVLEDEMFNYSIVAAQEPRYTDVSQHDALNYMKSGRQGSRGWPDGTDCGNAALWFDNDGIEINGDIRTNGRIIFDNSRTTAMEGKLHIAGMLEPVLGGSNYFTDYGNASEGSKGVSYIMDGKQGYVLKRYYNGVFGSYGFRATYELNQSKDDKSLDTGYNNPKWIKNSVVSTEYYNFVDAYGNPFLTDHGTASSGWPLDRGGYAADTFRQELLDNKTVEYKNTIDISVKANKHIRAYLDQVRQMSVDDRESAHIFYDGPSDDSYDTAKGTDYTSSTGYNFSVTSGMDTYPGLYSNGAAAKTGKSQWGKQYYKVIIVSGSIDLSMSKSLTPGDGDYVIVISLNGDIHVPNCRIDGILYAPHGTIKVDGNTEFDGSMVAQKIWFTYSTERATNSENHGVVKHLKTININGKAKLIS